MTGPERVDERRPPAFATGPKRDPGAHHAGADDDEVGAATRRRAAGAIDHGVSVSVDAARAAIAARVNGSATVCRSIHGPIWSL